MPDFQHIVLLHAAAIRFAEAAAINSAMLLVWISAGLAVQVPIDGKFRLSAAAGQTVGRLVLRTLVLFDVLMVVAFTIPATRPENDVSFIGPVAIWGFGISAVLLVVIGVQLFTAPAKSRQSS